MVGKVCATAWWLRKVQSRPFERRPLLFPSRLLSERRSSGWCHECFTAPAVSSFPTALVTQTCLGLKFARRLIACPSVQFQGVFCASPRLSDGSPTLPLKQFQCSSDWRWPSLVLSKKIDDGLFFLLLSLSPPGHRLCDVLGFVSAGSVSSSSTFQIFRDAS